MGFGLRAAMLAATLAVTGCVAQFRNHGYAPTEGELAALTPGVDTRESVAAAVGRPSAGGLVGDETFYYVQSRFRHFAFRAPREIERQVLALTFSPAGTLAGIERFGLEDGRVVALSRRTTDRIFADLTLIDQLLGNVGRIDPGALIGEDE